ncbi:MAG: trypsin-like peptidase domain-containing protein [Actinobacteria bacterium]|nr:trypsin-like peptidase domain-containing protein [Actinomycetota bacterium]
MQWRLGLPDRSAPTGPEPLAAPGAPATPDAQAPGSSAVASGDRMPRRRAWLPWLALTLVALLAATALYRTFAIPDAYTDEQARAAASPLVEQATKEQASRPPATVAAYEKIHPSLVVIRTRGKNGLGTGFVANANGTILTAYHVIDGASTIELTFADGTKTIGKVAGQEPEKDLATLTPARLPEVLVPATLGEPGPVGTPVHAAGNPLGLTFSFSSGVISALGRNIDAGSVTLKDLIQFDTAVNPGNSGGPLLDDAGRVVGVVTALANPSDQSFFVGIGFAVPITAAGGSVGAAPM